MKRTITNILLSCLVVVLLTACNGQARLQELVNDVNKECPVSLGEAGIMEKVEYDDNTVTLYYMLNSEYTDLSIIRANEDIIHENMLESYANNSDEGFVTMISAIVKAKADMEVVFQTDDGDSFTMSFTADELAQHMPNENADPELALQDEIKAAKLHLPIESEQGIVCTDIQLDDHNCNYFYECDEDLYDIDLMNQNFQDPEIIAEIKASVFDGTDPMFARTCKLLKATNRGIVYKYIGTTSGKTASWQIAPNEF